MQTRSGDPSKPRFQSDLGRVPPLKGGETYKQARHSSLMLVYRIALVSRNLARG